MPERVIHTSQSADLITFEVLVSGETLPRSFHVLSVDVEKEINRISCASILLRDGDPASRDFVISNQDLFVPGKEIEIKAGYHSDEETIFKGIVMGHKLKIRSDRSFLIVTCKDKAVKLTAGRKSRYFYESSDSEMMEEIISNYGLEKDIEPINVTHKELVQYNVSDWDFCITRAQANGMICVVDDGKILVKKPDTGQQPVETVTYGATMLDFDAEIDARHQYSKVTTYAWNASGQELLEAEANDPGVSLNGNITPGDLAQVIGLENLALKNGSSGSTSLQLWADSKALFNQMAKTRGRLKFQGLPAVKPGTMIKLEGVGNRFNGNVFISAVRHQIAEGNWTTDAQFGISPKWFIETADINDLPAAGLTAAVHGLQVGIVTQLESDPEGEDRILVRFPVVDNQGQGIWARVATLDAGENRGSFFRPEIGDEVIVGFINDNPNDAVVLGMMNSSAKPAPLTASDENHEKGFITRSNIRFIFNDGKKSVSLETPGGKKMTLDDDAGVIHFEDEKGNKVVIDSDGITLDSSKDIILKATGDIRIEGMNISAKANTQFKAEGSAGAEISTSAVAVLKGSLVQIN